MNSPSGLLRATHAPSEPRSGLDTRPAEARRKLCWCDTCPPTWREPSVGKWCDFGGVERNPDVPPWRVGNAARVAPRLVAGSSPVGGFDCHAWLLSLRIHDLRKTHYVGLMSGRKPGSIPGRGTGDRPGYRVCMMRDRFR